MFMLAVGVSYCVGLHACLCRPLESHVMSGCIRVYVSRWSLMLCQAAYMFMSALGVSYCVRLHACLCQPLESHIVSGCINVYVSRWSLVLCQAVYLVPTMQQCVIFAMNAILK
jgi:hypothetical protein